MKIEILTTQDCSNCSVVEKMLDDLGFEYKIIDITEKPEYLQKYAIYIAPGIIINGNLEFTGIQKRKSWSRN